MKPESTRTSALRRWVLRSTLANYLGQLATFGTGFALTPFVLHQIGAIDYGLWLLVGSVVAYGGLLDLGITSAVIKYVAEYRARDQIAQAQSLIATALSLYTALGLLVMALAAALAPLFSQVFNVPPDERATASALALLMGVALGVSIPCTTSHSVLRGLQRFDYANLVSVGGTLLSAVATVVVLLAGGGLLGMVAVNIPVTLAMQVLAVALIKRSAPELHFGWRGASRRLVRTVLSFSSSMFLIQVAGQLQSETDEIVIGAFLPVSAITPYGIAQRLSEVAHLLTRQFVKVLLPLASELHAEDDQARLRALFMASTRLTLASFLPIGCVVVILAQPILTLWVGAAYASYAHLVLILTTASLIDTSQWPAGSLLQGMARHRLLAFFAIGSGLVNLALSLILVRPLGVMGVALGTLIPTTIESLCFVLPYAMRIQGVSLRATLREAYLPALAPAVPMVAVLVGLRELVRPDSLISIAGVGCVSVLVYLAGYMSFGAGQAERQLSRDALRAALRFTRSRFSRAGSDT